jgi:hypothetical protein
VIAGRTGTTRAVLVRPGGAVLSALATPLGVVVVAAAALALRLTGLGRVAPDPF